MVEVEEVELRVTKEMSLCYMQCWGWLLHSVQEFLCTLDEQDVDSMTPLQRDKVKDVALHACCTHLSWWNAKLETKEK